LRVILRKPFDMTVVEIKSKLHEQIEHSDEKLLKIIYAIAKEYRKKETEDIDDARKKLVMAERERYLAGTGKSYSWQEVKNMAINSQKTQRNIQ